MSKMMGQTEEILTTSMLSQSHKTISYSKYKEQSKLLVRVCDFVELFSSVNQQMIKKDDERVLKPKKKSRLTPLFRGATKCLVRIEELVKEIHILPVKQHQLALGMTM